MKITNHKFGQPYKRKIHIDGKEWSWRIASPNIWIRSADGTMTVHTDAFEISGTTWEEYFGEERYPDSKPIPDCPVVVPSDIKRFVTDVLKLS